MVTLEQMLNKAQLTTEEKELSRIASKQLGFDVLLYRDGNWICDPISKSSMGFGATSEEAITNCAERNKN